MLLADMQETFENIRKSRDAVEPQEVYICHARREMLGFIALNGDKSISREDRSYSVDAAPKKCQERTEVVGMYGISRKVFGQNRRKEFALLSAPKGQHEFQVDQ